MVYATVGATSHLDILCGHAAKMCSFYGRSSGTCVTSVESRSAIDWELMMLTLWL